MLTGTGMLSSSTIEVICQCSNVLIIIMCIFAKDEYFYIKCAVAAAF